MTDENSLLKNDIEERLRQPDMANYRGGDWWQLTTAEAGVFDIEPERWPRMMLAYLCFETFLDITQVSEEEAPVAFLEAERVKRHDLESMGHCVAGFTRFAADYVGLTGREADATYWKMHFWNVRGGITEYDDDE